MTTSPAPGRGGTPIGLERLRRNKGLGKAPNRSVVEEMTAVSPASNNHASVEDVVQPAPVQLPATAPVAAPVVPAQATADVAPAVAAPPAQIAVPVVAVPPPVMPAEPAAEAPVKKVPPKKASFFQTKEQGDRMRRTYNDTRHLTQILTLSEFICIAVEKECARLEAQYNDGQPYTSDPNQIPKGRPVGG